MQYMQKLISLTFRQSLLKHFANREVIQEKRDEKKH